MQPDRQEQVTEWLLDMIKDVALTENGENLLKIALYSNSLAPTDLSLHLLWSGTMADPGKSHVGQSIAETLKAFGLLDHSVWVEKGTSHGLSLKRARS